MEYLVQGCTRQLRPNEFGHTHCNLVLQRESRTKNGDRFQQKIELYRCDNQIIEYVYSTVVENLIKSQILIIAI